MTRYEISTHDEELAHCIRRIHLMRGATVSLIGLDTARNVYAFDSTLPTLAPDAICTVLEV